MKTALRRPALSFAALLCVFATACQHAVAPSTPHDPAAPAGYTSEKAIKRAFRAGEITKTALSLAYLRLVAITNDVPYAVESERNVLDVYQPRERNGDAPVLLLIHGGAWDHGDKKSALPYAMHFAARGYLCIAMNYRLSDTAPFPAALNDVRAAIAWIRDHAADYGGDPGRIAVAGHSAGAHLAMLAAYTAEDPQTISCVIDFYGPVDLTAPFARRMKEVRKFVGAPYRGAPDQYRAASPIHHITAQSPPTLIIHGDIDD
ncbi:MAG TPA: alpha/beta hydrolase, partial [Candidatus Hydrogenedentes bacterium]|nr:alpha/beta hydrolase [Candidatus Hydrogenedentota bacterium]